MARRISVDECNNLYSRYHTPAHVIGHCRAVCHVALTLGKKLNEHGYNFDLELIQGAALTHDVARVEPDHALVGAKILEKEGFFDEADIVRVHMRYHFGKFEDISETDLVCLGDRLVKEDQYVGLDERIDYIIHKAGNKPEVTRHILESKARTRDFMNHIEEKIGQTIDSLF